MEALKFDVILKEKKKMIHLKYQGSQTKRKTKNRRK